MAFNDLVAGYIDLLLCYTVFWTAKIQVCFFLPFLSAYFTHWIIKPYLHIPIYSVAHLHINCDPVFHILMNKQITYFKISK